MDEAQQMTAWNNLVMNAEPSDFEAGDKRRAAAIASTYMGLANNGGMNSFLSCSHDLDAREVLASLEALGALIAAAQFKAVLEQLGDDLPACKYDDREDALDRLWSDDLNEMDFLSGEADQDLAKALERHVEEFIEFYLQRAENNPEPEWLANSAVEVQQPTGWLSRIYRRLFH